MTFDKVFDTCMLDDNISSDVLLLAKNKECASGERYISEIHKEHNKKKFIFTKKAEVMLSCTFDFSESQKMLLKLILYYFKNDMSYFVTTKRASEMLKTAKDTWMKNAKCNINWKLIGVSKRTVQNNLKLFVDNNLLHKESYMDYATKKYCYYPTKQFVLLLNVLFGRTTLVTQTEEGTSPVITAEEQKNTTGIVSITKTTPVKEKKTQKRLPEEVLNDINKRSGLEPEDVNSVFNYSGLSEKDFISNAEKVVKYMSRKNVQLKNKIGFFSKKVRDEAFLDSIKLPQKKTKASEEGEEKMTQIPAHLTTRTKYLDTLKDKASDIFKNFGNCWVEYFYKMLNKIETISFEQIMEAHMRASLAGGGYSYHGL